MSETWPDYCMDCGAMGEPHESNCPIHEELPHDWVVGDAMLGEQDASAEPRKADKDCGVSRRDAVKRLHDELDEWPKPSTLRAEVPEIPGWRWEERAAKPTLERRDASGFIEVITETDWRANYYPFKHAESMPDAWTVGEERMDAIGVNGGEGLHYAEDSDSESALSNALRDHRPGLDKMHIDWNTMRITKQPRYQDAAGDDWIDEFARTATTDEFRGAMRFIIGKYNRRAGKKDELASEIRKMRDYCDRWLAYEEGDA